VTSRQRPLVQNAEHLTSGNEHMIEVVARMLMERFANMVEDSLASD
jgi:hypothetical protein